jgi:hypothetical protein
MLKGYAKNRLLVGIGKAQHFVCGEINVIPLAIAIGLAILDYTYFLRLRLAAAMER